MIQQVPVADQAAPSEMRPAPGDEDRGAPADGALPPDQAPAPQIDCSNYDFQGEIFNCDTLDRCAPDADANYRLTLACCQCYSEQGDPTYCGPPDCEPEPEPGPNPPPPPEMNPSETCMTCHNGATHNDDYSGPGMTNPHPFPPQGQIKCTSCHGGNPRGQGPLGSHVPPPPGIGDRLYQQQNPQAAFNRRSLAGIDLFEPAVYESPDQPGVEFSNLDYLQFVNPGDLRVVAAERGCGQAGCHLDQHGQWVPRSTIGTTTGFFSGTRFIVGVDSRIQEHNQPRYEAEGYALAEAAPRPVENPTYDPNNRQIGEVGMLLQQREIAQYGPGNELWQNPSYDANNLNNDLSNNIDPAKPNRVLYNSNLDKLIDEQVSITCGNCHLYSAGNNDRFADFRSSGCTACHMQYSMDGRSRSQDRNVNKFEPVDPDAIQDGERAHIADHTIRNVAKVINGAVIQGISDEACVGCHQGSNRTVLQYWGIRLDQNEDLTNETQYPANPVAFQDTAGDERLYDPVVQNATFNGREATQYILSEDYDGDGLDDTPPDVHYDAGLGCIDCHGSRDLHGGTAGDPNSGKITSRQDQDVKIRCESCHGSVDSYAATQDCRDYQGQQQSCGIDSAGNSLRHMMVDAQGNYWLRSRLTLRDHYIPQTKDLIVNNGKTHPTTRRPLYSPKASYAMGRADGNPQTGIGPLQADPAIPVRNGFSHTDTMDCASCHASWTNNCIGCHLATEYNANADEYFFSNITGERILLKENAADFVYQNMIPTYLGINSHGYITQISPAEKMFYRYVDLNGNTSDVFAFSDRLGEGNNPNRGGRNAFPALAMNQMAPHSIRGRPKPAEFKEGMRYCATCHLNQDMLDEFGALYEDFIQDYQQNNDLQAVFSNADLVNALQQHVGQNTGNTLNSPLFVHMVAGLGTALFLFDENGCPVNPYDAQADRQNCNGVAPADVFDANTVDDVVRYDLDRIVQYDGQTNSTSIHPRLTQRGPRRNASNSQMAGPLNRELIEKLTNPDPTIGLVLDSWINAEGELEGQAELFVQ
ncbi:MAG: hypothetical protein VYD19_10340 [Myxococcota bacterium]|nr:hypothetical protein [Myxococcota bacterium]